MLACRAASYTAPKAKGKRQELDNLDEHVRFNKESE
jgi:hypothetical protein